MKRKSIRVQVLLSSEVETLLEELSVREHRTRSAIVELALLAYAERAKANGKVLK
jgi:predicted transcriptional regulator